MQMSDTVEKKVPSSNPLLLWVAFFVTALLCPAMLFLLYQGAQTGDWAYLLGGAYGAIMTALSAYLINRQLRNPDWLRMNDEGFEYKFLNITFRVGWGDVQELRWDGGNVIKIRLADTDRVAFNSLVDRGPRHRTQFNPYTGESLRRTAKLKRIRPKTKSDLADFLREVGTRQDFHIAIPVFESAAEAEHIFNEMQERLSSWRPKYEARPSITARSLTEASPLKTVEEPHHDAAPLLVVEPFEEAQPEDDRQPVIRRRENQ